MTVLATYYVLRDAKFSLIGDGASEAIGFTLPADFTDTFATPLGLPTAHLPVLNFVLDSGISNDLVFRVLTTPFGGTEVEQFRATYNSDVYQTIHEAINLGGLTTDLAGLVVPTPNEIRFERVSGTGSLDIGDVVLWYKRDLLAIVPLTE